MMQELQKREEKAIFFDQSLPRHLERSLIVVELFLPGRKKEEENTTGTHVAWRACCHLDGIKKVFAWDYRSF